MKAPLRFMFGWVIYLFIFAAINYPMAVIWEAVKAQPVHVSLTAGVAALVLFIWFFATQLVHFWAWCDATRTPIVSVPEQHQLDADRAA